jgi:hypothetical protein|nr:MAG TPA: homing endonuclease [Caudoviricetes sp.]
MQEIWKDVPNFEGIYQVSNLGNVKSLSRCIIHRGNVSHIKGKIMKPFINRGGYKCIKLSKNQKYYPLKVHRLVALAFIPNPNNYECVNHKDENKQNNTVSNLEWCTKKYNNEYGSKALWKRKVYKYNLNGVFLDSYESVVEASKANKIPISSIRSTCDGNGITTHGLIFVFDKNDISNRLEQLRKSSPIGVAVYDSNKKLIEKFDCISDACLKYNVSKTSIHRCCKHQFKKCKGYYWEYY